MIGLRIAFTQWGEILSEEAILSEYIYDAVRTIKAGIKMRVVTNSSDGFTISNPKSTNFYNYNKKKLFNLAVSQHWSNIKFLFFFNWSN